MASFVSLLPPAQAEEVLSLIDELGLIPASLVTRSLVLAIRAEFDKSLDSLSTVELDTRKEFLERFVENYRKRSRPLDEFYYQGVLFPD